LLPYQQEKPKKAKISLTCKSQNLKSIKLVTSLFDEKENPIRSDTLFVSNNSQWKNYSKNISLKGSRFFNIELMAEGIELDTTAIKKAKQAHRKGDLQPVDSAKAQNLWIDNIQIELDGINVSRYAESEILEPCRINPENIISIENEASFALISALKDKKIIAVGESLHGSEAFDELFYQMVKYQVQYNNCKLILLEMEMTKLLPFNSFIQGNENFDVDSMLYDERYTSYSTQQLKNILLFLKNYNQSSDKKVHLMGIDINPFHDLYISEYLYMLNKNHNYKAIDTVCSELTRAMEPYISSDFHIRKIESDPIFKSMLSDTELQILSYCCKKQAKILNNNSPDAINVYSTGYQINREKWMFDNSKYLIDLIGKDENSTVLIKGHKEHLSFNGLFIIPSNFGHFMKELYGDQYYGICLVTNEGDFRTTKKWLVEIMPLKQDTNSIESLLSDFSDSCMYVPVQSIEAPHIKIRSIGATYIENQFHLITPALCFDAIIYIKKTESATYWPNILGTCGGDITIIDERSRRLYQRLSNNIESYAGYLPDRSKPLGPDNQVMKK
jgi:erythromycin esterase-like protein